MALNGDYEGTQSRLGLEQLLLRVCNSARLAHSLGQEFEEASDELEGIKQTQPEWGSDTSSYWLLILFIPAVFLIDIALFGPTVEYLISSSFSQNSTVSLIARILIPACVVLIELGLAFRLSYERKRVEQFGSSNLAGWLALAVLFNIAVLGLVAGTQLAIHQTSELPAEISLSLAVSVCLLALLCHGAILFMGRPMQEAKNYVFFSTRHGRLKSRVQHLQRRVEAAETQTVDRFRGYSSQYLTHRQTFPGLPIEYGPFENSVIEIVGRRLGEEILNPPLAALNSKPTSQKTSQPDEF